MPGRCQQGGLEVANRAQAKILNVNDNPATLLATGRALRRAGYQVIEAVTGAEALEMIWESPDLVILDVQLPDISGFEVCRRIKANPATTLIPVLHLSAARVDDSSKIAGLEGGADGYLAAPVQMQVLLAYVRALLRMHRAETEVMLSSRQWEVSFHSIEEGVCLLDSNGVVIRHNPAFSATLGAASNDLVGGSAVDLMRNACDVIPEAAESCLTGMRRCADVELRAKDRWLWLTLYPVSEETGQELGAVMTLVDVTERKRMEEQTIEAKKMAAIQRLTTGMAHDFNNLLTAINGFAELLITDLEDDVRLQSMAGTILRSGERAAGLVNQLMAFSQRQHIVPEGVDLGQLLAGLAPSLADLVGESTELVVVSSDESVVALVDPLQMEQVIMNLVTHAGDSMPAGGEISLDASTVVVGAEEVDGALEVSPGRYAMLRVRDTGPGMSEDVKSRIFEPFLFISDAVAAGTGMRLAAAYGIVKQSKGHIWVDSVPGQGTTFSVLLPVLDS
jgi:PAS domain S-box-containing protein